MWERALGVSYTNPTTWLKYAEMEMRHRFINHARNVWDRAVSLLPRVDQLWCVPATQPSMQLHGACKVSFSFKEVNRGELALHRYKYIHMEEMLGNVPGARQIFERWMAFEPDHHGWMAYIKVTFLCTCLHLSHPPLWDADQKQYVSMVQKFKELHAVSCLR